MSNDASVPVVILIPAEACTSGFLQDLKSMILEHGGSVPIWIRLRQGRLTRTVSLNWGLSPVALTWLRWLVEGAGGRLERLDLAGAVSRFASAVSERRHEKAEEWLEIVFTIGGNSR